MATLVVTAGTGGGQIDSADAVYANARAGTGVLTAADYGAVNPYAGQLEDGGFIYGLTYFEFDASALADDATISGAVMELFDSDIEDTNPFTIEVRLFDYGGGAVSDADFIAGADLGALPLLATIDSSARQASQFNALTDVAWAANISKTAPTRVVVCTSRMRTGDTPGSLEFETWAFGNPNTVGQEPKLTITYTEAAASGGQAGALMMLGVGS